MCISTPKTLTINTTQSNIEILSFNVEGLSSMCDDPDFLSLVNKHDICLLTATWKNDESTVNIPGYWDFSQARPKHKKARRPSGGVTVMSKYHLRAGIKVALNTEGFIWLKLEKNFFNFINDVYLCAAYIPPQYTCKISILRLTTSNHSWRHALNLAC
jgi:hypothetical protein